MIIIGIGTERKLFSDNPTADRIIQLGNKFEQYYMVVLSLRRDNFKKTQYSTMSVYPTNSISKLFYIWDALVVTFRILKKLSVEERKNTVLTAQDPFECGIVALILSKFFSVKLHVQIHTDLFSPFFKNTWLQHVRMIFAPLVIRSANALRCDSKRMTLVIDHRHMSTAPIAVLPIFVDTSKYTQSISVEKDIHYLFPEKRIIFLIASRLEPEKDLRTTVRVFASVIKKYPQQAGLVIVGSGSCEQEIRDQVNESGIAEDIVFIPWTNDLWSLYRSADIFLITSLFEGYALTIAESLLCGTPVLATDVGVAPEILFEDKTGWIVEPKNQIQLEEKIEYLISNPEKIFSAKNNLKDNPYIHPYAGFDNYQKLFIDNISQVFNHKK